MFRQCNEDIADEQHNMEPAPDMGGPSEYPINHVDQLETDAEENYPMGGIAKKDFLMGF